MQDVRVVAVFPVVVLVPKDGLDTAVRRACRSMIGAALAVCAVIALFSTAQAEVLHDAMDGLETSWQVRLPPGDGRVLQHSRETSGARSRRCEALRFSTVRDGTWCSLETSITPARALDELTIGLWVRSSRPGIVMAVQVVFPGILDPQTGVPLTAVIRGESYQDTGRWQQLHCRTTNQEVARQLARIRAQYKVRLADDPGMVHVNRVLVGMKLSPGTLDLALDDLEVSPHVPVSVNVIEQTRGEEASLGAEPPMEFRLDRLLVAGRPFFPIIVPYHGESLSEIHEARFNTVWTPDLADKAIVGAIRRKGLWITAAPPQPGAEAGDRGAAEASLLPFGAEAEGVLFWMLGARIPSASYPQLQQWIPQVQQADRAWNRPIAADVIDDERLFSRNISMLGISRHSLNGTLTLQGYRTWLSEHRGLARPGTFCWTWLQTEPSPDLLEQIPAGGQTPILEPEQIRLQLYTALMAGYRGVGYWSTGSLEPQPNDPVSRERWLAIKQLNLELSLLEPWLGSSLDVMPPVPFTLKVPQGPTVGAGSVGIGNGLLSGFQRDARLRDQEARLRAEKSRERELTAAAMRTDYGTLVLPVWLERHAQFCPDQMAGNDATFVIPGVGESASAWEITTTGVQSLIPERVAGGLKVTLRRFDQTAAILFTSDRDLVTKLERKAGSIAEVSARTCVELAQLKLERVRLVDEQLKSLAPAQPDGPQLLATARGLLGMAETSLRNSDWASARLRAGESLQLVRKLQRAHWYDAIRRASPVSSPYTMCFQTLPDHWKMLAQLGRSPSQNSDNLLPSGEFDDLDTFVAEGWQNIQSDDPALQASAELYPQGYDGSRSSLRLSARVRLGHEAPRSLPRSPVTIVTPQILVRAGQLVHISGWVKVPQSLVGDVDGLMIYDNLLGKVGAMRFHEVQDWQQFEMYREVRQSGPLTVTLALHGLGDLQIDRLRIAAIDRVASTASHAADAGQNGTITPRDRFPGLPRFAPLRGPKKPPAEAGKP